MKSPLASVVKRLADARLTPRLSTSLSDNQRYPQACLDAVNDYAVFNNFRRLPDYNAILEHVNEAEGAEYLQLVAEDKALLAAIDEFRANDDWGNPRVYDYPEVGLISPTTLRYIKVLGDLKRHFDSLDNLRIAEIGVGYGGQCRVINAYYSPAEYTLIDIQPALALAQRYLDNYILYSRASYQTMNELAEANYDLVISNYAFTELPRTIQEVYFRKVIAPSRRGYITYNQITPPEFNSFTADELLGMLPGSQRHDEVPLTHPDNCILVWG